MLVVIKEVQATGELFVITKRGTPVAQVMRVDSGKGDVFGFVAGEFKIRRRFGTNATNHTEKAQLDLKTRRGIDSMLF
jgi:antitoxin (DNA-binding transcriptional repressor) of toxin-antitoxin stability system